MFNLPRLFILLIVCATLFLGSCKKNKSDSPAPSDDTTEITTVDLSYAATTQPIYGQDYTFKLRFDKLKKDDVVEYGIAYSPWISRSGDRTCLIGGPGTFKFKFGTQPNAAGIVETLKKSLAYADFNDANYRAYAILANGSIVYGVIKYIVFA